MPMGAIVGEDGEARDERVSYAADIRPMFRGRDRMAAISAFDLWSYEDVVRCAAQIAEQIADGSLPLDGPLSNVQVSVFDRWVAEGAHP